MEILSDFLTNASIDLLPLDDPADLWESRCLLEIIVTLYNLFILPEVSSPSILIRVDNLAARKVAHYEICAKFFGSLNRTIWVKENCVKSGDFALTSHDKLKNTYKFSGYKTSKIPFSHQHLSCVWSIFRHPLSSLFSFRPTGYVLKEFRQTEFEHCQSTGSTEK